MPTYIIINTSNLALKGTGLTSYVWVKDARMANIYTSKYQAKRHLKQLDNVPNNIRIVQLVNNTIETVEV